MQFMRRPARTVLLILALIALGATVAAAANPTDDQLSAVRERIGRLERDLGRLSAETETAQRERSRLDAELELADAEEGVAAVRARHGEDSDVLARAWNRIPIQPWHSLVPA